MRTFKLQVQTTVDGYMAGPNGEMDWMTLPWSHDLNAHVDSLIKSVDRIVLGRTLAEGFIPVWESRREEPQGEDAATIEWMNTTPKVVVSNTLAESPWENTTIASGDLAEIVHQLKSQPGGDLITYGGVTLAQDLIAKGLLDELHLFVNPTAIGAGKPVFPKLDAHQQLRLVGARSFDCGVSTLHYEPMPVAS